jgi:uncharacterized ferritin-like protein (DUF455 family)
MRLRDFAEQILFSETVADKLITPESLDDTKPGPALSTPHAPGRPDGLSFPATDATHSFEFPNVNTINCSEEIGKILHFFANHELLALELMALCILKFPDAPETFRRGLAHTMSEEQRHVRMYCQRLHECGVELGEIPVNDFFWRCTAPMDSPRQFVAQMSLTFEQANLDYSRYYADVFETIGDPQTAALMRQVYEDEIAHVRHGLMWFNRWRDPEESVWDAYRTTLRIPLTPNRAKGIGFNREGRLKAGLQNNFIDELEVYAHSKGRSPAVFVFDANAECSARADSARVSVPAAVARLNRDLELLPLALTVRDDTVLVNKQPSVRFRKSLLTAGFTLPEFIEWTPGTLPGALTDRRIVALRPWAWTPASIAELAPLKPLLTTAQGAPEWTSQRRDIFSKAWSLELLHSFIDEYPDRAQADGVDAPLLCAEDTVGRACESLAAVDENIAEFANQDINELVVKAAFGAAGQMMRRFSADSAGSIRDWTAAALREHGTVILEPWLDKIHELSLLIDVEQKRARVLGHAQMLTTAGGQYIGTLFGRTTAYTAPEVLRFLYGGGQPDHWLNAVSSAVGNGLRKAGYLGPAGIDVFIFRDDAGRLRLKPIVEINPRFTMGHVALRLARRVAHGRGAMFRILNRGDLRRFGHESFTALAEQLAAEQPPTLTEAPTAQLTGGTVFLTDPERAAAHCAVLLVGDAVESLGGAIAPAKV